MLTENYGLGNMEIIEVYCAFYEQETLIFLLLQYSHLNVCLQCGYGGDSVDVGTDSMSFHSTHI